MQKNKSVYYLVQDNLMTNTSTYNYKLYELTSIKQRCH